MAAKLKVVEDLITYLDSKIDIDDDLKAMLDSFVANLKGSEEKVVKTAGKKVAKSKKSASDSDEPKKKRAPSVFNLYVKDVMPLIKAKHPEVKDGKVMMGLASASWKTDPMGLFIKGKVLEMKKDDKDGDVVVMFAKAKAMYVPDVASDEEVEPVDEDVEPVDEDVEPVDEDVEPVDEEVEHVEKKKASKKEKKVEKKKAKKEKKVEVSDEE
jgi:hypothetical protein